MAWNGNGETYDVVSNQQIFFSSGVDAPITEHLPITTTSDLHQVNLTHVVIYSNTNIKFITIGIRNKNVSSDYNNSYAIIPMCASSPHDPTRYEFHPQQTVTIYNSSGSKRRESTPNYKLLIRSYPTYGAITASDVFVGLRIITSPPTGLAENTSHLPQIMMV